MELFLLRFHTFRGIGLWYAAGLRSLGPVWSRPTAFGHGVPFRAPSSPDTGPGLTEPGRALVARCGELGIAVDLSHLNEAGFWDVAGIGAGPLIASHSAAHALCRSSRNLTDRQLDEIAATGGLVGIVYACPFLREDFAEDTDTPIEVIARHAAYVAERIGAAHVGLGSDFDGAPIPTSSGTWLECRGCLTRSRSSASPIPSSTRSPGTTGDGCSATGGATDREPLRAQAEVAHSAQQLQSNGVGSPRSRSSLVPHRRFRCRPTTTAATGPEPARASAAADP